MLRITVTDQAKQRREKIGLYGVLNALENTLGSVPFEVRKALHDTLMDYAEDCPSEYALATGPLAPTLLCQLLSVIERDPGTEAHEDTPVRGLIRKFVVADGFVTADGKKGRVIAILHYDDWHPDTEERFKLRDYLVRWEDNTHSLFVAGELPGDMPFEKPMTLEEVFEWYQDEDNSAYIERVTVQGGLSTDEAYQND